MIYVYKDEIPADTAEKDKRKTDMKLERGIIHRVRIQFPPGCGGVAHAQISRGKHQLYPTNPDESFAEDDSIIDMAEWWELEEEPYQLEMYTWNTSTSHSHTIRVTIGVLPREVLTVVRQMQALVDAIKDLFRLTTRL